MKKLIETALPLIEITASSIGEKIRKGHPGNLHLWWNRSPIVSSVALLYAALVDEDQDTEKRSDQTDLLKKLAKNESAAFEQAKDVLKNLKLPFIWDGFSGFGGLSLACEKLNLQACAGDLNTVATLLTKAVVEFPPRFTANKSVHPDSDGTKTGTAALADDILYYGQWMEKKVQEKIGEIYPAIQGSVPSAWLWVRTVECPNPVCKCRMPLASSFVLTKSKGKERWAEPVFENEKIRFQIHEGICPAEKENNKLGIMGAKFRCPACGEVASDTYIKKKGKEHQLGVQMMAVVHTSNGDKVFDPADEVQTSMASVAVPEDIPSGQIAENSRWFSPPGYGFTDYADLYTKRQLTMLSAFCNLIPEVIDKVVSDALSSGSREAGRALCDGGNGALAYGQAIGTYLSLAISKMTNYHCTICSWDNRKGTGRAVFTRQAIPMTWTFVEENPFAETTGSFHSVVSSIAESVLQLLSCREIPVTNEDAIKKELRQNSILFTELPYYDNVGYADLSDYFYIWLRKCLKNVFPDLFKGGLTRKDELSSIQEHYGGDASKAKAEYREKISKMLMNFSEAASDDYPSVLFFDYTKKDRVAIHSGNEDPSLESPLSYLIQDMMNAGFCVTAIWPIRTEKPNEKFQSVRIAIVFRKNHNAQSQITRRNLVASLGREMPVLLEPLTSDLVDDVDRSIVALGFGFSIVTRYKKILNADGSIMSIQDSLPLIAQEAEKYFALHETNIRENDEEV